MGERFTDQLWESVTPIYRAILGHPFLAGLADGSLPEAAFRHYVLQDARYLREFARCLALAATKAPRDAWCELFAQHATVALVVERSLHAGFIGEWGLGPEHVAATAPTPTTLAYTSYLLRVAYAAPFEELIGAVLPCYWIYWEVGTALEVQGSPNPLYQRWIDTYAAEQFGAAVRQVREVLDAAVAGLPEPRRAPIREHFVAASRYEWMFWDAAWRQERWPLEV